MFSSCFFGMGMGRIGRKPIGFVVELCVPAKVQLSVKPQASPQGEGFAWAAFCILCVKCFLLFFVKYIHKEVYQYIMLI